MHKFDFCVVSSDDQKLNKKLLLNGSIRVTKLVCSDGNINMYRRES